MPCCLPFFPFCYQVYRQTCGEYTRRIVVPSVGTIYVSQDFLDTLLVLRNRDQDLLDWWIENSDTYAVVTNQLIG